MNIQRILGLRAQKKIETKRKISQSAMALFLKLGFDRTRVEDIVEPLQISKRTFFRYFMAKEDIVFAWYEELTTELLEYFKVRPATEDPFKTISETLLSLLYFYDHNREWAFSMIKLIRETSSLQEAGLKKRFIWEQTLTDALMKRHKKRKISKLKAKVIVGCAMSAFMAAVDVWYESKQRLELRSLTQKAFRMARSLDDLQE